MYTYFIIVIFVLILVMQNRSRGMAKSLQKLIQQSARYATASQQDKSPAISILHANYANAYLNAAKDIGSDAQIHNSTGIDVNKFAEHIKNVQDMVTKRTAEQFSGFTGQVDVYLAEIGGEV